MDSTQLQDRRLADDADARDQHRLLCGSCVPSPRSRSDVCASDRETDDAQRRRHHRQGFRSGPPYRGRRALASWPGWRAGRDAEQVRAQRRSALMDQAVEAAGVSGRRVLFVTGRLAEPALRRVLGDMTAPFSCDVAVLGITVASLMTTEWIASHLELPGRTPNDLELIL